MSNVLDNWHFSREADDSQVTRTGGNVHGVESFRVYSGGKYEFDRSGQVKTADGVGKSKYKGSSDGNTPELEVTLFTNTGDRFCCLVGGAIVSCEVFGRGLLDMTLMLAVS